MNRLLRLSGRRTLHMCNCVANVSSSLAVEKTGLISERRNCRRLNHCNLQVTTAYCSTANFRICVPVRPSRLLKTQFVAGQAYNYLPVRLCRTHSLAPRLFRPNTRTKRVPGTPASTPATAKAPLPGTPASTPATAKPPLPGTPASARFSAACQTPAGNQSP